MEYIRLDRQSWQRVYVVTTESNSEYLIGGASKIGSGLVVVRTTSSARVQGKWIVGYCPTHHPGSPKIQIGQRMCLGRQGNAPDARAVHTSCVTSIRSFDDARLSVTNGSAQFVVPDGHELTPLAQNILAHR